MTQRESIAGATGASVAEVPAAGMPEGPDGPASPQRFPQNVSDLTSEDVNGAPSPSEPTAAEVKLLRTRIAHLEAEHQTLRLSHAEALSAAVEEREERLREQQEHVRRLREVMALSEMILNSAGEGIFGLDREGRFTFVNPAAARMLGRRRKSMIGRRVHEIVHHRQAHGGKGSSGRCAICDALCDGTASHGRHDVFWRRDGTSFPIEYTSTPIREKKAILGAVVTFRDITQRRLLEAKLRQAQKLESIGQLAAGIAHEINTPTQYLGDNTRFLDESFGELRPLLECCAKLPEAAGQGASAAALVDALLAAVGQADLDYLVDEIPRAIQQSLEGLKRVAKIVRSMKEFSHPGGEQKQAVDLNRAIESTLTVSRNEWKYVAEMVTEFAPDLPLVTCLPGEINQVVLNLVINAAHAIADCHRDGQEPKGTIRVTTRRVGDFAEVRVADTGSGIPDDVRRNVFDPFFTTKEVGRGTGQGLAIAHSVVCEKHGGTIDFETEPGKGTTFVVRLPTDGAARTENVPR